jgi:hypothetical protein
VTSVRHKTPIEKVDRIADELTRLRAELLSDETVYTDDNGTPIDGAGRPSYDQDIEDL